MAARFVGTYEVQLPSPGVLPTCDQIIGVPDPISITTEVTGATVTTPLTGPVLSTGNGRSDGDSRPSLNSEGT